MMNIKSLYFYFYCFIYTHLLLFCSTNTAHSLKNKKINTLFLSISKPQFSSHDTTVIMSSEKITSIIRPILRKHLANTNYDRMFPVLQFLDYYDHCLKVYANLCPLECYKSFTYIPITLEERGGSCVGLTLNLYNILPKVFKAYIVASKLASKHQQIGFPEYAHTAILIKYRNPIDSNDHGIILLDSGFDIDEPIVLKQNGEPVFYNTKVNGIWKFYLKEHKIFCEIEDANSPQDKTNQTGYTSTMVYNTKCLLNPIESIVMPMLLVDRKLSMLSRQESGLHAAHVNIELNKHRVVWSYYGTRFKPIGFDEIINGQFSFPPEFAAGLHISPDELNARIRRIIKDKHIIDQLYYCYIDMLRKTGDFKITGPLDLNLLDAVLTTKPAL